MDIWSDRHPLNTSELLSLLFYFFFRFFNYILIIASKSYCRFGFPVVFSQKDGKHRFVNDSILLQLSYQQVNFFISLAASSICRWRQSQQAISSQPWQFTSWVNIQKIHIFGLVFSALCESNIIINNITIDFSNTINNSLICACRPKASG